MFLSCLSWSVLISHILSLSISLFSFWVIFTEVSSGSLNFFWTMSKLLIKITHGIFHLRYMCFHVCVYLCVCIHICLYMYACVNMCVHICVCVCAFQRLCLILIQIYLLIVHFLWFLPCIFNFNIFFLVYRYSFSIFHMKILVFEVLGGQLLVFFLQTPAVLPVFCNHRPRS